VYNHNWVLNPNDCYTFEIYDSYGDGICCSYGQGYYKIRNSYGTPNVFIQGGQFGGVDERGFGTPATVGVEENGLDAGLNVFPNPTEGVVTLDIPTTGTATVDVFNMIGARVFTSTFSASGQRTLDLGALSNGVYHLNVTAGGLQATRMITISK
jgi:hypothetical protein